MLILPPPCYQKRQYRRISETLKCCACHHTPTPLRSPVFMLTMAQGVGVRGGWGELLALRERTAAASTAPIKASDSHLRLPLCVCTCVRYLGHASVVPGGAGEQRYPGLQELLCQDGACWVLGEWGIKPQSHSSTTRKLRSGWICGALRGMHAGGVLRGKALERRTNPDRQNIRKKVMVKAYTGLCFAPELMGWDMGETKPCGGGSR